MNELKISNIKIDLINAKKEQPRQKLKNISLLARNIKENGLINPISVEKKENKFEIISGERRFRACKLLKWKSVPCIVRKRGEFDDLAENFCRDDLSIVEKAQSIDKVLKKRVGGNYSRVLLQVKNSDFVDLTQEAKDVSRFCDAIGYSAEYIYKISKIMCIDLDIRKQMIRADVGSAVALKLCYISDRKVQQEIIRLVGEGVSESNIIKKINEQKFFENKNIQNTIEQVKKLFKAYNSFNKGVYYLKTNIPLMLGLVENFDKVKRQKIKDNVDDLLYFFRQFQEKSFEDSVFGCVKLLEELSVAVDSDEFGLPDLHKSNNRKNEVGGRV